MDVIGIVQTDLNEFNILFNDTKNNKNKSSGQGETELFSFLMSSDNSSDDQGNEGIQASGNSGQGQNLQQFQEMVVRIKGVPEGQKATFLQMYQMIQDANTKEDLEQKCTVVSIGEEEQ